MWGINVGEIEENHARLLELRRKLKDTLEKQLEQAQKPDDAAQRSPSTATEPT